MKGIITLAFGGKKYTKLAYNLFLSLKFNKVDIPFTVICDVEDKYTKKIGNVKVANQFGKGFMNKLNLDRYTPYDETIFIDADCLAIKDIAPLFETFEKHGNSFSAFGHNVNITAEMLNENYKTGGGYFKANLTAELNVKHIPSFNGGIYYFKNDEIGNKVFGDARKLYESKKDFGYPFYGDEPYIALSMAINNCYSLSVKEYNIDEMMWYPRCNNVKIDPSRHVAVGKFGEKEVCAQIVHFGTFKTYEALYKHCVYFFKHNKNRVLINLFYKTKLDYVYFLIAHYIKEKVTRFFKFIKRCFSFALRKIKKIFKK